MKIKLMITILMIILVVPSLASAGLSVLSGSQLDFYSSDSTIGSEAFLMQVTENGGSEKIMFSNFDSSLDQGYDMKSTSGYISGSVSDISAEYPFFSSDEVWGIQRFYSSTKFFWGLSSAYDWCNGLVSNGYPIPIRTDVRVPDGTGYYTCYGPIKVGDVASISGREYNWEENFKIYNPLDGGSQDVVITSNDRIGNYEYSPDKNVFIKYAFSAGSPVDFIPNLETKYSIIYKDSEVYSVDYISSSEISDYSSAKNAYNSYWKAVLDPDAYTKAFILGDGIYTLQDISAPFDNNHLTGLSSVSSDVDDLIDEVNIYERGYTDSIESGRVILKPTDSTLFARSPVFTVKIDAKWVGVFELVGKPNILDFYPVKESVVEGDSSAGFVARVRNDVNNEASFNYVISCDNGASIDNLGNVGFDGLETKTTTHTFESLVSMETGEFECCLVIKDTSSTANSGPECASIKVIERSQCNSKGVQECVSNSYIRTCIENDDGILVWSPNTIQCDIGCSVTAGKASCNVDPGKCEADYPNMICESSESFKDCPDDCTFCGDGYCGVFENDETDRANYCEADCKIEPPGPVINWTLIIISSVAGLILLGAVFLRLRKDGYFDKR